MEKAGDILKRFLKEKKLEIGFQTPSLNTGWDQIAGAPLSYHTRVADIAGGKLIVEVEHPGWYQVLLFRQKEILRKLNRKYPSLKAKEIRIRYQAKEKAMPAKQEARAEVEKPEKAESPSFATIADEKLKKSLESLYRGIVRKN